MYEGESGSARTSQRTLAVHRALSDVSRVRILDALRRAAVPLDVGQLAEQVGLHHNTVRSHLDVLLRAGLVSGDTEKRDVPGRPRVVYRPAPVAEAEDDGFRLLAHILTSYLAGSAADPESEATEAGRSWGRYLIERPQPFERIPPREALTRISALLSRLGFAPELVEEVSDRRILLHRCPFRDLAVSHPEITCAVHLGLIRGALAEMGAPVEGTGLDRFVEPSLCVAHFRAGEQREPATPQPA